MFIVGVGFLLFILFATPVIQVYRLPFEVLFGLPRAFLKRVSPPFDNGAACSTSMPELCCSAAALLFVEENLVVNVKF